MARKIMIETNRGLEVATRDELDEMTDLEGEVTQSSWRYVGIVCDDKELHDMCNTDCRHYSQGTCPELLLPDSDGKLWHCIKRA